MKLAAIHSFYISSLLLPFIVRARLSDPTSIATVPPDDKESDEASRAWNLFQDAVAALETSFQKSPFYTTDRLGAYTLLQYFVRDAMDTMAEASDGQYPHFVTVVDPDKRMGIDNPDTFYRRAFVNNVDGRQVYTIKGTRGTTSHFSVQVVSQNKPEPDDEPIDPLEGCQLQLGDNREFEITLSVTRPEFSKDTPQYKTNWMALPAGFEGVVLVRDTFSDWDTETAGFVNIERKGAQGQPAELPTPEAAAARMNVATQILLMQGYFWGVGLQMRKLLVDGDDKLPKNELTKWQTTPNGLTTQHFSQTYFVLEDHQAIIITAKATDAPYHGLEITDVWGVSPVDWSRRQTSLSWGNTKSQAHPSEDAFYHFVVSAKDPEVENWIDTAGLSHGMITFRLQGKPKTPIEDSEKIYPQMKIVEFDKVKENLPDETPTFDEAERQDQLRRRQAHIQRRYINW